VTVAQVLRCRDRYRVSAQVGKHVRRFHLILEALFIYRGPVGTCSRREHLIDIIAAASLSDDPWRVGELKAVQRIGGHGA
jgi:hypothetical protein